MRIRNFGIAAIVLYVAITLMCVVGYSLNIYKLAMEPQIWPTGGPSAEIALRIIGIPILPIGIFMGLFVL